MKSAKQVKVKQRNKQRSTEGTSSSNQQQHVNKHCPCRGEPLADALATQKKSQRIATRPTRDAPHAQPHVHSPCAQPLDDGWLPHVKMLQLLARCELARKRKAAHRVHRGGWRRVRWRRRAGRRRRGEPAVPAARLFLSACLCSEVAAAKRKMAADKFVARSVHTASTLYFLPIGAFMRDAGQRDAEHFSVTTKDTTKRCLCEFAGLRLEHGEPL